jgi:hypothetical protein
MKVCKSIVRSPITEKEKEFLYYLGNSISDYIENKSLTYSEIVNVFIILCGVTFTKNTPFKELKKQCEEIDDFCSCLKMNALRARTNDV